MTKISAIIITLNEERNIKRCVLAAQKVSDEVIILDSFSTDKTVEIAKELNIDIKERATLKLELNKGAFSKVKNMFDKSDIAELKSITE